MHQSTDPEFLSPEGERAWTWLRRHLDRANAFWLAFILTDDLTAQRVLRERVRTNRRLRAQPLLILQPSTPDELTDLLDELETRGAAPPGCTWVAASQLADDEWLAAWRAFLLALNHRRDVLRARLGGLVIVAPPAVKVVAQRESPDLWSVRDLLIELAARPVVVPGFTEPSDHDGPRQRVHSQGLTYESSDPELVAEAQVLLAMPVAELAGPARERVSRAVHRAAGRGENQLAAVLLLAQSDGYRTAGDPAGGLHLVQEGLTLEGVEPRTRERLVGSGVELALTNSELEQARQYALEWVALTERRVEPDDPDALHDHLVSLNRLGDVVRSLDPTLAAIHYQRARDLARSAAADLGTPRALRDLAHSLSMLGDLAGDLGDPTTARDHYQQALEIHHGLAERLASTRALRDLAHSLGALGDAHRALAEPDNARSHYQAEFDIYQRLADRLDTLRALRDLAYSLDRLGSAARDLGDLATARTHHQRALDIRQRLADRFDTPEVLRNLANSYNNLGDLARALGDLATARTYHQQALDIHQRLAERLHTPRALRNLSYTLDRLGDVTQQLGEPAIAANYYQEALNIARRLSDQLHSSQAPRSVVWSLGRLGDVTRELDDPATAATYYREAQEIAQRLADQLQTPQAFSDLAWSLGRLGAVTHDLGDLATARTYHQQALDIRQRLAEQRNTHQTQRELARSLAQLGEVTRDLGDLATARTYHQQALDIDRRFAEQLSTAPALQGLRAGLTDLARTEEELGNTERAVALRAEAATVSDQLVALSDDSSDHPRR